MSLDKPNLEAQLSDRGRLRRSLTGIISAADANRVSLNLNARVIEQGYAPLLGRTDLTANEVWMARMAHPKEALIEPGSKGSYSDFLKNLPESEKAQWYGLYKFLCHDIAHIMDNSIGDYAMHVAYAVGKGNSSVDVMRQVLPPEFQEVIQRGVQRLPNILRQLEYPHQFAKAIAEMKLGKSPTELESIDVRTMLDTILTSLQLRFVFDNYMVTSSGDRHAERNEIVADLSPSQLETNPGMIWSVLYNLIKNAAKEVSCEGRKDGQTHLANHVQNGQLPEAPIKIHVKLERISDCDATVIHVADSGDGLRVDEIMDSLKNIITQQLLKESNLKLSVQRILADWERNPFAVRGLRMGDVYDLAGLARVSGFATQARLGKGISSGLGLWGATYLTSKMGGEILYTNTSDGGALFTVIIPNHYFTDKGQSQRKVRSEIINIRRQLERGTRYSETLPRAA